MTLSTIIEAARDLATHNQEEGLVPKRVPYPEHAISDTINRAIQGSVRSPSPHMWAMVLDAQSAARFLDRAQACERLHHMFQAESYRKIANRKLSEAVSYML